MFHCSKPSFSPFRCFLSNDSKPVAAVIKNILECVLDYGLCLTGGQLSALDDSSETPELQSHINLSEVIISFTLKLCFPDGSFWLVSMPNISCV